MELRAFCMRCGREYYGPDEGCPACDKDNPNVTIRRNSFFQTLTHYTFTFDNKYSYTRHYQTKEAAELEAEKMRKARRAKRVTIFIQPNQAAAEEQYANEADYQ